jgi:hypothetical protein
MPDGKEIISSPFLFPKKVYHKGSIVQIIMGISGLGPAVKFPKKFDLQNTPLNATDVRIPLPPATSSEGLRILLFRIFNLRLMEIPYCEITGKRLF